MKIRPNIELIAANAIFGVSYSIALRLVEMELRYQQIFIVQIAVAALIFIPIALFNPRRRVIARVDIVPIALCATITMYGWSLLTLRSVTETHPIVIAELSTLGPTVTILAAAISQTSSRRGVRILPRQIRRVTIPLIALLVALVTVLHDAPIRSSIQDIGDNVMVLVAVVSMGVSTVIISNLELSYGTTTIMAIYFAVALLLLPLFIPDYAQQLAALSSLRLSAPLLLLSSAVTMALPLYLLYRGALQLTPLHTALYRYIQPLIAFVVILADARSSSSGGDIRALLAQLALTMLLTLVALLAATSLMSRTATQ